MVLYKVLDELDVLCGAAAVKASKQACKSINSTQFNSIQFNSISRIEHILHCRKARPKFCCMHKGMTQNLLRAFLHGVKYVLCGKLN